MSARLAFMLLALALFWPHPSIAQADDQLAQVQAAYFFNFIKYTTWPRQGDSETLHIRILRDKQIHSALVDAAGTSIHGKTLDIRQSSSVDELTGANAVFIPRAQASAVPSDTWSALGTTMLVVSDWEHALEMGATIQLQTVEGKLRFAVNLTGLKQSHIDISSKLLRLASEVHGE
jgi:hypothetical protein